MKSVSGFVAGSLLLLTLAACAPQVTTATTSGLKAEQNPYESYTGPRAKVVIAAFACKAQKCSSGTDPAQVGTAILGKLFGVEVSTAKDDVGAAIADMLTTAAINTNHFVVYDRSLLDTLQKEANLGNVSQQLQSADLLIAGTITAFEPDAGRFSGGGAVLGGILGVAGISQKKAYIAVDFRVIDVRSGAVVAAFRVEGEATDTNIAGTLGALAPALGGALGQYQKTPMGKAIALMVANAAEELIKRIPAQYFKYGPDGRPLLQ
ncbi:CsgG/HfaB family protein [Thermus scotoductus]|uniref:CsgG/HfaB family protein n=1 Tax=Thermus scotoductus TaxID=37636 RepID=UPI0009DF9352|nr:CsgG/HfaB family protein [Thermus scotoductus]